MGRILSILASAGLALALFTMAPGAVLGGGTGTGTGTGGAGDCSPGYFKNHTEDWVGLGCGLDCEGTPSDGQLLDDLQERGPGSGDIRAAAAECLNACTGCTED